MRLVLAGAFRHPLLMRAPAQFGRLQALGDEAFHRPGIEEDVRRLRVHRPLGVALGDVDALDPDLPEQRRPFLACLWIGHVEVHVAGDVERCLLDEERDHARVGTTTGDGGRAAWISGLGFEREIAERVVRALARTLGLVEIEAEPGLVDRVDVECAEFAAEFHDVDRAGVDRKVDAEALSLAHGQERGEEFAVILLGHMLPDQAQPVRVEDVLVEIVRIDDEETVFIVGEMALDHGQGAASDRAEADHHNRSRNVPVDRPIRHSSSLRVGKTARD